MVDYICPRCGARSLLSDGGDGGIISQDLAMHQDLRDVPRPAVDYRDSPNRSRGLSMPRGIVVHYTAGGYDAAIRWFQSPTSNASAHFLVAKDGRRVQMVPLPNPDTAGPRDGAYEAWHCRGGNKRYVGIEHEGHGRPDEWTDRMLESSAELAAYVCSLYEIPIAGPPGPPGHREWFTGFGGHDNVPGNDHVDPGRHFPWQEYLRRVASYLSTRMTAIQDEETGGGGRQWAIEGADPTSR